MSLLLVSPSTCPCEIGKAKRHWNFSLRSRSRRKKVWIVGIPPDIRGYDGKWGSRALVVSSDGAGNRSLNIKFVNAARRGTKSLVLRRVSDESFDGAEVAQDSSLQLGSHFTNFQEDPIVAKLRTQLGSIHPIPSPPMNRNFVGLFVLFFFVGVIFDKIWTTRKAKFTGVDGQPGVWPQVPTSFSSFLERDLQRKESVEWVNMVLGKLWKVYRPGIENWIIGLLQPVIDGLEKPDYVDRVEVKQFSLGDEPLSVRNVERRTSRRANDLQYQIGLRYTGGARMQLKLSLKFGFVPVVIPVGVRDFDIDGELWVKLRLIPSEPWVGAASWAFVSLPKIKLVLSMFRSFNLMAIPVLSMFLRKLLTEDLPRLFVRPKKIYLDFQQGKAVGPVVADFKSEDTRGNEDHVGELSITLVDARKLPHIFFGKTDPYVILSLGDQVIRSKKNSQTTVIGRPGEPIWNQDFLMLVANPRKQKLNILVKDSLGFSDWTVGAGEVDLCSLEDTVPTDKIVALQGGWGVLGRSSSGEILLRLTYKAYVEDEEDDWTRVESVDADASDDELSDFYENNLCKQQQKESKDKESFVGVLAALIVSEEFQGIVATEAAASSKVGGGFPNDGSLTSKLQSRNGASKSLDLDPGGDAEVSRASAIVWFSVITGVLVLIAINMGGSSLFNP